MTLELLDVQVELCRDKQEIEGRPSEVSTLDEASQKALESKSIMC